MFCQTISQILPNLWDAQRHRMQSKWIHFKGKCFLWNGCIVTCYLCVSCNWRQWLRCLRLIPPRRRRNTVSAPCTSTSTQRRTSVLSSAPAFFLSPDACLFSRRRRARAQRCVGSRAPVRRVRAWGGAGPLGPAGAPGHRGEVVRWGAQRGWAAGRELSSAHLTLCPCLLCRSRHEGESSARPQVHREVHSPAGFALHVRLLSGHPELRFPACRRYFL